ncbi:MAG: hypothetical protein R3208_14055 [Ketobacteraceae bacterium]|nr:hypothetical protein [Ketobacteraceae bacterium]
MYAFNKRFRATTFKGLPYATWAYMVLGTVLIALSIGAYVQARSPLLGLLLCGSGLLGYWYAHRSYQNKDKARLNLSRFIGKRDRLSKSIGL